MRTSFGLVVLIPLLILSGRPAEARKAAPTERIRTIAPRAGATDNPAPADAFRDRLAASAAAETTWLLSLNEGEFTQTRKMALLK